MPHVASDARKAYTAEYYKNNRAKIIARVKTWRENNPSRVRANRLRQKNNRLKYLYGITYEEYRQMFENQEGLCAGCSKHLILNDPGTHIDHDHKTGKVRGILCYPCNAAIGYAKDSSAILKNLVGYLGV